MADKHVCACGFCKEGETCVGAICANLHYSNRIIKKDIFTEHVTKEITACDLKKRLLQRILDCCGDNDEFHPFSVPIKWGEIADGFTCEKNREMGCYNMWAQMEMMMNLHNIAETDAAVYYTLKPETWKMLSIQTQYNLQK